MRSRRCTGTARRIQQPRLKVPGEPSYGRASGREIRWRGERVLLQRRAAAGAGRVASEESARPRRRAHSARRGLRQRPFRRAGALPAGSRSPGPTPGSGAGRSPSTFGACTCRRAGLLYRGVDAVGATNSEGWYAGPAVMRRRGPSGVCASS